MDSFIDNLKHQVQCLLCKDTMTEPKLLKCFHTYCKSCLKRHVQIDEQGNTLECPRCSSKTMLQDVNDVEDLQTSSVHSRILKVLEFVGNQKICSVSSSHSEALWQCLDCDRLLCNECLKCHSEFTKNHHLFSLSDLKKEDIEKMLRKESPCAIHDNQEVDVHCQDCDMLICNVCLKDHRSHKSTSLQEFIKIQRDSLTKSLEHIQETSTDENKKKQQEEIALMIQRHGQKAKEEIKKMTKNLIQEILDNEQHLLNQVETDVTKAEKNLRIINHTTQAQEFISNIIEVGTASDLVSNHKLNSSQAIIYDPYPQYTAGFLFDHNEELCQQVKNGLGQLRPLKKADVKMSSIKVDTSSQMVGSKSKLTIELRSSDGDVTDETVESVTIQFTPEDYVEVGEIQMTDDREITGDFTPHYAGRVTLDVMLKCHHISNSPQVMPIEPRPIKQVTVNSKLNQALNTGSKDFRGIAVNKTNSRIAVAAFNEHCVRVYNMHGDLLLVYGSKGCGQGQLNCPEGLAFLNETDLVIADCLNNRICTVNTSTGKLIKTFGREGKGNGQFEEPRGVHVDDDSNIIVCDSDNNRVKVFTKDGGYLYQFNTSLPYSVVTHNGLFYVSSNDFNYNSKVYVIEMKDNQPQTTVALIDTNGIDSTSMYLYGLAIDNDKTLLVCDYSSHLIYKFTLDGRYVGRSAKLTISPRYLAVLNDGQVICTTFGGGCIFLNTNAD